MVSQGFIPKIWQLHQGYGSPSVGKLNVHCAQGGFKNPVVTTFGLWRVQQSWKLLPWWSHSYVVDESTYFFVLFFLVAIFFFMATVFFFGAAFSTAVFFFFGADFFGAGFLAAVLGNRFHVNFLGYAHWFMSIRIPQLKYHSIYMDQARYATYIVANYLDTAKVKVRHKFYKTTLPADLIFTN